MCQEQSCSLQFFFFFWNDQEKDAPVDSSWKNKNSNLLHLVRVLPSRGSSRWGGYLQGFCSRSRLEELLLQPSLELLLAVSEADNYEAGLLKSRKARWKQIFEKVKDLRCYEVFKLLRCLWWLLVVLSVVGGAGLFARFNLWHPQSLSPTRSNRAFVGAEAMCPLMSFGFGVGGGCPPGLRG